MKDPSVVMHCGMPDVDGTIIQGKIGSRVTGIVISVLIEEKVCL